jgi:UDP-glucose 4-epimerase
MKHHVIVGGAGFVGLHVVNKLLQQPDVKITIVDNFLSSEEWCVPVDSRITLIVGSGSNVEVLNRIQKPIDFFYQLACFHGNQSSISRPLDDFENGLKTTLMCLDWVSKNQPNLRFVYSGAGCAVAEKTWDSPAPVLEIDSTALSHDSPYSISKITGEMYCIYFWKQFNIDVIRVRFQNVYGPGEILGAGQWRGNINTIWRNAIPTFIWKALNSDEIEIYGGGVASRDFIYVEDLATGVIAAATKGKSGEVYNLATEVETSIIDVVSVIVRETKSESKIIDKPKRSWDNSGRRFGSKEKSRRSIGFEATTAITEGLEKTIAWTVDNRDEIANTIRKHSNRI